MTTSCHTRLATEHSVVTVLFLFAASKNNIGMLNTSFVFITNEHIFISGCIFYSDLPPVRHKAILSTNAVLSLIGPWRTISVSLESEYIIFLSHENAFENMTCKMSTLMCQFKYNSHNSQHVCPDSADELLSLVVSLSIFLNIRCSVPLVNRWCVNLNR